jgi:hypothetical protein
MMQKLILKKLLTTPTRFYGNLKDSDRIFTNVYGDGDFGIKGSLQRVRINNSLGRLAPHQRYSRNGLGLDNRRIKEIGAPRPRRGRVPLGTEILVHAQSEPGWQAKLFGH